MGIERADVVCPFYRYDDGFARIVCEGFEEKSSLVLQYQNKNLFNRQLKTYCCSTCNYCEVFQMLMKVLYEE